MKIDFEYFPMKYLICLNKYYQKLEKYHDFK